MKKLIVRITQELLYVQLVILFIAVFACWAHHTLTSSDAPKKKVAELKVFSTEPFPAGASPTIDEGIPTDTASLTAAPYDRSFILDRMEQWLDATKRIVKQAGNNRTALGIISFLEHSLVPMRPILDGQIRMIDSKHYWLEAAFFQKSDGEGNRFFIGFIPIQPSDLIEDSAWRRYFDPEKCKTLAAHISMVGGHTAIAVRDDVPFSDLSKAIILLHEGGHGKVHDMTRLYDNTDTRLWQEMMLAELELKLYHSLGDKSFGNLVRAYVRQFGTVSSEMEDYLMILKNDLFDEIVSMMDWIYGPSLSDEDRLMRFRAFAMEFVFTVFDLDIDISFRETKMQKEQFVMRHCM